MLKRQKVQRSKRSNKEIVPKALFVLVVEGLLALEWAGPGRDFLARPGKPGSGPSGLQGYVFCGFFLYKKNPKPPKKNQFKPI